MPRTERLSLADVAERRHLAQALHRAARGKHARPEVRRALRDPEATLAGLAAWIRAGTLPVGGFSRFVIHDPKRRVIHAAPFLDRVVHHALIARMEPAFERVLLPQVFASRPGRGVHAAVAYAQRQFRRAEFVVHLDVASYFPSIRHDVVRAQLGRRFRGDGLRLCMAVLAAHEEAPGRGLPIGALTSQHFANHYLAATDRWVLDQREVTGYVRYMDDMLLFGRDAGALREVATRLAERVRTELGLMMKAPRLQRTRVGLCFCGVRIRPHVLRPSVRRQRRYRRAQAYWEDRWARGEIDALALQRNQAGAEAILRPAPEAVLLRLRRVGEGYEA